MTAHPTTQAFAASADGPGSWRSPLLDVAGSVPGIGVDAPVAWHYGNPVREQRRLEAGTALVDQSHRGVIRIAGPDRLSWLHSLTTQSLAGLAPGESSEALVLSPHGHVEHALHLVDDGTATWLTVEPGTVAGLVEWLARMRFLLRVEAVDVTSGYAVVAASSAEVATELALRAGSPAVWSDPWPAVGAASADYSAVDAVAHPAAGRIWWELLLPRNRLAELVAGQELAGTWAAEALRVVAWRPRLGLETDHRTIPHELDWLRTAVHLQKGCYRGQETVVRVHNLGCPPRRLVMLHLDGSENVLPDHGAPVRLGTGTVGWVTTAARHHELGPVGLALVKRSVPVGAELSADGVPATQEPIVAP